MCLARSIRLAVALFILAVLQKSVQFVKWRHRPFSKLTGSKLEACDFMAEYGRPTWDMLRGIGVGLDIEWEQLQRYTLSSYLLDFRHKVAASTNEDEA